MLQFLLNSKQPVPMNVRIPLEHLKTVVDGQQSDLHVYARK